MPGIYACDVDTITVMGNTVNDCIFQGAVITTQLVIPLLKFIVRFSYKDVFICRGRRHPPRSHPDTNNRNSKGGVTFIWGFTQPYDFYPFCTVYPAIYPVWFRRILSINKCKLTVASTAFPVYNIPKPSAFDIRGESVITKIQKGIADRRPAFRLG